MLKGIGGGGKKYKKKKKRKRNAHSEKERRIDLWVAAIREKRRFKKAAGVWSSTAL